MNIWILMKKNSKWILLIVILIICVAACGGYCKYIFSESQGFNLSAADKKISNSGMDIDVYEDVLYSELNNPRHNEEEIYFGYGFIDEDSFPELFIVRGNSHTDTVTIYSYNETTSEPLYVGDFGGWGYCDYIPYENSIISCYGNQGFFYIVESGIDENYCPYVKDVILRNGGNKIESYYGFTLDGFNGSMDIGEYDINMFNKPDEKYLIDENKADSIEADMRKGSVRISAEEICINKLCK